jgi:hypothetical protein
MFEHFGNEQLEDRIDVPEANAARSGAPYQSQKAARILAGWNI